MQVIRMQPCRARVLLLEPNYQLRSAIVSVLCEEPYLVETCDSLEQVLPRSDASVPTIALVAWQSMQGLLAEEHRQQLCELTRRVRLIVMMPRHWARLLEESDLGRLVAGLVAKPVQADDLLSKLESALRIPVDSPSV
jgi:DNA-binding response OmpR family regulator